MSQHSDANALVLSESVRSSMTVEIEFLHPGFVDILGGCKEPHESRNRQRVGELAVD